MKTTLYVLYSLVETLGYIFMSVTVVIWETIKFIVIVGAQLTITFIQIVLLLIMSIFRAFVFGLILRG